MELISGKDWRWEKERSKLVFRAKHDSRSCFFPYVFSTGDIHFGKAA